MAKKNFVRENVPLSRFGVLVAQLESIVASASQQPPDALLCFDLLSDLISSIDEEPQESILLWQRKCEDALYALLTLGARRPVRHLASIAMAKIILKGDCISIYSRASSLQGFLSDGRRSEPLRVAGAAQCLGELYRHFGRRITSGLLETTIIATKLLKYNEEFVRQEALHMLQNALEGSAGTAAFSAYTEAYRLLMRLALGDKSFVVRIVAARCLKTFANIGGPGLGVGELDNASSHCVKALEDPVASVRDAFAEALGALLALAMNPEAQVQPRGKGHSNTGKKLEGCLQRHLSLPFTKANGARLKDLRIGLTFSWMSFLQVIRLKYLLPDTELQSFALQVMDMLRGDISIDAQALACVLYILRVGVTDQMTEPTQRSFLVVLGNQLQSPDVSPSMRVAALRTLSYTLKTLGEVPHEFKEVLDNTVVASLSHSSLLVRIEASLALRALAEVDPTCVGGLISYGVTTLNALKENVPFEKGINLKIELDSLHGQATLLAALVSISPDLPLGYPARLPKTVLEVSKKMLTESSRNPVVVTVEQEAGWLLLSSLLASMPNEELEDQVFDILSLWADLFSGNAEYQIKQAGDLASIVCVWSAAIDALTRFISCFLSGKNENSAILLQPVVLYLSRALSYISLLSAKDLPNIKPAINTFIIRVLMAYQSLYDPMLYINDHTQIIQLCTMPFRDAAGFEESSCLRLLLDKRDASLGPWIPGRDLFEDELRAFQGGKDGLMPCVWANDFSSFPQPETISKTLVNQMLLCFGTMFASQDSGGMLSLLGIIEHCLRTGKKQSWHAFSVTNICVGLLAGLKALLVVRSQAIGLEILNSVQAIFLSILAEGDICASQRRASCEGLGLLARLGNDTFTAKMTRSLLGDLTTTTDSFYAGSIALALGCIHRSAGGIALSTLVPATVSSVSSLAKSSIASLQIWSLHGLLLTIEAAGLSFVSHVQGTLGLALDILLSEENGQVHIQQAVGRLVNAIVAVIGPELSPGSIFFSRCKSVVAEISFWQETATLLERVRFTQQLVLFAPQAVSVHNHVQSLLPTLSSRQPTLRHLAVSTLRHLIEKDSDSIVDEQIEHHLFRMLDEETDSEIGNLVRTTIMRLLYASCPSCPSHWISLFRTMVLSTSAVRDPSAASSSELNSLNNLDGEAGLNFGEDDENMVSNSKGMGVPGYSFDALIINPQRGKHLRYRTRVFAAECLSHLPAAVGKDPAHFDLSLARRQPVNRQGSRDWLVLHVQELISLAYQISTLQFESMQPIGVRLLSTIIDKCEKAPDPELPGHILLEQYQAQLVSAVRIALDSSSGPDLLEAGLQLATKILTSGIISGDQVAVKRIYSLISRPLDDFKDLYYPSFAEWVSCKIKVRLLAAHASLKCFTYAFLRRHHVPVPDEYLALMPLFSKSSSILGKYWIYVLKDYSYVCFRLHPKKRWKPFLDGIQSPLVSSKLQPCLEEAWPVILQALSLDAVPQFHDVNGSPASAENTQENDFISGYGMVELDANEFQFLWGFALLVLFQGQEKMQGNYIIPLDSAKSKFSKELPSEEINPLGLKSYEVVLPVFQFLSTKRFFSGQFLSMDVCKELLQVFTYSIHMEDSWNSLAISVMSQIMQNCPEEFLYLENFAYLAVELCLSYLLKISKSSIILPDHAQSQDLISPLFATAKILVKRLDPKKQLKVLLAFLLVGFHCIKGASTDLSFSKVDYFFQSTVLLLRKHIEDKFKVHDDDILHWKTILVASLSAVARLTKEFIDGLHLLDNKRSNSRKLLLIKLTFSLEQIYSFAWLTHETVCLGENECDPMFASTFKYCSKCFHEVLSDSDMQVQAIGLQVLKSSLQKEPNLEDNLFSMFFSGELIQDIFVLIQNNLKKLIARESVAITTECLRVLVLMQTLSKETECQKRLINLLLEAVVLVFSATEDSRSQEVTDIRSTTLRLVSHLAQVPSSAAHFKDILLTMPVAHRQQLQGIIRASVTQDQSATQIKSTAPTLEIKLPVPTNVSSERTSSPRISTQHDGSSNSEEEEDDWDAFQSFPASTATDSVADTAAEESTMAKNSLSFTNCEDNEFQQFSTSQFVKSVRENTNEVSQEDSKQEVMSETVFAKDEIELLQDSRSKISGGEPSANGRKGEDEVELQKENDLPSLTIQPIEDAEGSAGKNLAAGHEILEGGLGNMSSHGIISGTPLIESTDAEVLTQNAQSSLSTEDFGNDEAVENAQMFKPVERAKMSPGKSAVEGHEVSDENLGDFTSHETSSGKPPHKESNDTEPLVETPQSLKNNEVVEVIEDPKTLIEKELVEDHEQAEESPNASEPLQGSTSPLQDNESTISTP